MDTKDFLKKCKEVRDSRFNSSKRIGRRHKWASIAIPLLSMYTIIINLLVFIPDFSEYNVGITIATIMMSIFVLVLSLLVNISKDENKIIQFFECGQQLSQFVDKIDLRTDGGRREMNDNDFNSFLGQYHKIIRSCKFNHDTIDRLWSEYENACCSSDKSSLTWLRWHVFDVYMLYALLLFLMPIALIIWAVSII